MIEGVVAVPLYEVVLREDGAEEVRHTDRPLRLGQRLEIDGKVWEVEGEEAPSDPEADSRYILRPAHGGFLRH